MVLLIHSGQFPMKQKNRSVCSCFFNLYCLVLTSMKEPDCDCTSDIYDSHCLSASTNNFARYSAAGVSAASSA